MKQLLRVSLIASLAVLTNSHVFAQETTTNNDIILAPENSTGPNIDNLTSLMFLPKEVDHIKKAEKARDTKVPIEILLPEVFGSQLAGESNTTRPQQERVPVFDVQQSDAPEEFVYEEPKQLINPADTPIHFLRSILYLSNENWTIWMDDQKISSLDEDKEINDENYGLISVVSVEPRKIIAVWEDFPYEMVSKDFEEFTYALQDDLYASEDMQLVYDAKQRRIAFMLQPNQAIVPYLLSVVEGKNNATFKLFDATKQKDQPDLAEDSAQKQQVMLDKVVPAAPPEQQKIQGDIFESDHMKQYMKQIDLLQGLLQQAN